MQVLPFADGKCLEAFAGFERGVYAGLDAAGRRRRRARLRLVPARVRPMRAGKLPSTRISRINPHPARASSTHGEATLTEIADSYVCGIADAPLLGDTIGHSLDLAARRWGDREALVSPSHGVRWTWKELAERVDALAAGFLALGLEPGARIGVWSLNRPEWTLTQFAAAKAGLILVTINPAYRLSELEFALGKGRMRRDRHGDRVQDQQLHGDAEHAAAGARERATRRSARGAAAATARGDPGRRAEAAGHHCVRGRGAAWAARATARRWRRWPKPCSSTMPSTSSSPAAPPDRPRASR